MPKEWVATTVDMELFEALEALCAAWRCTRSGVIREALRAYLTAHADDPAMRAERKARGVRVVLTPTQDQP